MIPWSDELDNALNAIAKRKNPDNQWWRVYYWEGDDIITFNLKKVTCSICGYCIKFTHPQQSEFDLTNSMKYHGMGHLKEYNLLPFI